MALGFSSNIGGGWAEQALGHCSMLFPIPDSVPDRATSLHEPLSIVSHGLLRQPPIDGDTVAIVGAGVIGLAALAAVRALFPNCTTTVLARHPHQADAARRLGADHVVQPQADLSHYEEMAAITGGRVSGRKKAAMLIGGYRYVVEAVGNGPAVNEALRIADNRATVMLLGAAGTEEYDLTHVWWKELALVGAINHSFDPGPGGGATRHSVARAIDILAGGYLPDDVVVTHEFGLDSYREAVETAIDRKSGAIKVVFRPQHG
jgi:threonine dehydrogenase-like Zn-dependent dehydrogenase